MRNHVQRGDVITLTSPAEIASGDVVQVGAFIGVAATDASVGDDVETSLAGVFELPKAAVAISQGDTVYWSSANTNVSKTSAGNTKIGIATMSAAVATQMVAVRLDS